MRFFPVALVAVFCGCSSTSETPPAGGDLNAEGDPGQGGACEADLQSDPSHCGACGHSCLGGGCVGGRCLAIPMAHGLERPRGIALHAGQVYFASVGIGDPEKAGVFRLPADAPEGAVPERLAGIAPDVRGAPVDVKVDDRAIYVARRAPDAIEKISLAGGDGSFLWQGASSTTTGSPYALALDETHVHAALSQGSAVVLSVPKNGGAARGLATDNPHYDSGFFGVTASEGHVVWASQNKVLRVAKSGGAVEPVLGFEGDPRGVVHHEGMIYWTDWGSYEPSSAGTVMSCSVEGCTEPKTLATGLQGPLDLVVDGDSLYVTVAGRGATNGSIVKIPREGGEPEVLADEQATPVAIAVDDKAIYWTNGGYNSGGDVAAGGEGAGHGALMRLAK
jgi:hypothetical protein